MGLLCPKTAASYLSSIKQCIQCSIINPYSFSLHTHRNISHYYSYLSRHNFASLGRYSFLSSTLSSNSIALWKSWNSVHLNQRNFCQWLQKENPKKTLSVQDAENSFNTKTLDIRMESQMVFSTCWRRFEEGFGLETIKVPREVVWLNGAPGSGKGANTDHILKTRGLDCAICISSLLILNPETRGMIDRGDMIPDIVVGNVLLESLLTACPHNEGGVLVDGFPRTALQVDFLKLLHDKLIELHTKMVGTPKAAQYPRPLFKVVVLYVDEETSIFRQMARAQEASLHNRRVLDAGTGDLWEQRTTDLNLEKCKKRYEIFRTHYGATLRLKQFFPFHLIDAMGTLVETREAITTELRYQSSLDLSEGTYAAIRHLPLSKELPRHARQHLVARLDNHCTTSKELFSQVVDIIGSQVMPLLQKQGLAGRAEFNTDHPIFREHPRAVDMFLDVMTDRGFSVSYSSDVTYIPTHFDLKTGTIMNLREVRHKFQISWDTKGVRDMDKAIEIAARVAEDTARKIQISQSFIPLHQDREHRQSQMRARLEPELLSLSDSPLPPLSSNRADNKSTFDSSQFNHQQRDESLVHLSP